MCLLGLLPRSTVFTSSNVCSQTRTGDTHDGNEPIGTYDGAEAAREVKKEPFFDSEGIVPRLVLGMPPLSKDHF
jgi:hypothetical protein